MATKMLCHGIIRQLRNARRRVTLLPQTSYAGLAMRPLELITSSKQRPLANLRLLHVKVYDKDAGLEAQRAANKENNMEEAIVEGKFKVPPQKHRTARQATEESQHLDISNERYKTKSTEAKDNAFKGINPDEFGGAKISEVEESDAGDRAEEEYLRNPPRRAKKLRTKEYASLIKTHLNEKRLKDAIDVLEVRMLKEDRVKPENYIYNLLISGCAKVGYTRKAFSLFTKMRNRGLKVKASTYTSLFNACANAPSPEDGLGRAEHLREIMLEKGYEPNVKNYNAMIKAYGRWGDVKTAYALADELMERKLELTAETFNFLLQACASDKQFGFRHCLLTWHKMLQRGIQPDYYAFSTVLRCVRDTNFGDLETMRQVLQQILDERQAMAIEGGENITESPPQSIESGTVPPTTATSDSAEEKVVSSDAVATRNPFGPALRVSSNEASQLEIPNLLAPRPHLGSLIQLTEVTKPHERFLLLGGLTGFLELMKECNITPDIAMFTAMLEVIPPTVAAEKQLISFIRKIGLKADIDFFNVLIKKRSMRYDYAEAKEVLSMVRTAGLKPDIVTYGVLALGCRTVEEARELLQEMFNNGIRINTQILGAMLRQGCAHREFSYIVEIMQISLDENIRPNDVFLTHLHKFYTSCARAIDARHPTTKSKEFKKGHKKFCDKLRIFYDEQGLTGLKLADAIKRVQERPYDQYKEHIDHGLEEEKNKKLARKQKVRKYIKKIKVDSIGDGNPTATVAATAAAAPVERLE